MRYITYQTKKFSPGVASTITKANAIIKEYNAKGYVLTLRQLYYQFVARGLIENTERSYKNLGSAVNDGRMAGLLPWDGIEDRGREHHGTYSNEDMQEVFNGLEHHYTVDTWARQPVYVEAWVEKEALGNVLERPCGRWRVPHMSCKGYLSASAMWRAGERFAQQFDAGKKCVLIHLGDHDPSGIDMTRDNIDRLRMFAGTDDLEIVRIALNMDQVERYNPPPNPAKITDSRSDDYIANYGEQSWELDALEPEVIARLVEAEIKQRIDKDIWDEAVAEEKEQREYLKRFYAEFNEIKEFLDSNNGE